MSRSFKKHNIIGFCGTSERWDKKRWHKKLRSKCNQICNYRKNDTEFVATDLPLIREVSNIWDMFKDGKSFFFPWMIDPENVLKYFTRQGKIRK